MERMQMMKGAPPIITSITQGLDPRPPDFCAEGAAESSSAASASASAGDGDGEGDGEGEGDGTSSVGVELFELVAAGCGVLNG